MALDDELLNAQLGETDGAFRVNRIAELKLASYRMFAQAKRSIDIFSYDLDRRILSDREIEQAVVSLVKRSRHSRVRMLVFDTVALQSADHRLISVLQSFSSYVSLKVLAKDYQTIPFSFYLVDNSGLIYRSNHNELEAHVCFNDKLKVKDYQKQFDEMWDHSRVASEFRTLGL